MKTKLLTLIALALFVNAKAQIITTFAGNGVSGYSGDGGPATAAAIWNPIGITIDAVGNLYVAQNSSYVIRKIATNGIITTYAGSTLGGYSGDGGQATAAKLSNAWGITMDGVGNLLIADQTNNVIRMINTNGIISTIVGLDSSGIGVAGFSGDGGYATSAKLFHPSGVGVDSYGNIYVADTKNNVIRMVNTNGIISTIVGLDSSGIGVAGFSGDGGYATSAKLNNPYGVTVDNLGNLYIADVLNQRVRKVNTNGIIVTFAGSNATTLNDGGYATDAGIGNITDIDIDNFGNVYIADGSEAVRIVNTNGIINSYAGKWSPSLGFSGDGGPANNAQISVPYGITFDASGNLYVSDDGNNRIRKVTPACVSTHVNLSIVTSNTLVCMGNTINLIATGAKGYEWQNIIGYSTLSPDTLKPSPSSNTTFYVIGYDSLGCSKKDSIQINVYPLPTDSFSLVLTSTPHVWDAYPTYSSNVVNARWYWGDGTDTLALYPSHTYSVAGTYFICVSAYSACGDSATYCLNDSLYRTTSGNMVYVNVITHSTDISQIKTQNSAFSIYPNPTGSILNLELGIQNGATELQVTDVLGNVLIHNSEFLTHNLTLDVSGLPAGVYFVRVGSSTQKFIKQ